MKNNFKNTRWHLNRWNCVIALIIIYFLSSCKSESAKTVHTERDKTITKENSFSEIFLDSAKLESFITEQSSGDSSANRLRNFYNSRNYQFAWFTEDGLAEQALSFWNLYNNYKNLPFNTASQNKALAGQMDSFINADSAGNIDGNNIVETELQLTQLFFSFAQYAFAGKVNPEELQWHIPRRKLDAMVLLDSLIANKGQNIRQWEPVNPQYKLMYKELKHYYDIDKSGGWNVISSTGRAFYKQGDFALVIKQVKQRLITTGSYMINDTSEKFTPGFTIAVVQAQKSFGYKQDGKIDAPLIKSLNVPVRERIKQMLINMERMRWMPQEPQGNRILVNIPDFKLHVFEDAKEVFDIDIVVGTAANRTVIFSDTLKYVVFSPYWNVPRSIVRKEILPAMQRSSQYLGSHNMEQTGFSNGLPVIRQKPGGSNALGRVKFIFPNSYNIYFHDTPAKSLFEKEKRAFSHGCIRLAAPRKMADYLLRNQPEWTAVKISTAMSLGKEKWVTLNEPTPVFITYFTSWISNDGQLNFREDIYGHDGDMAERLFEDIKTH